MLLIFGLSENVLTMTMDNSLNALRSLKGLHSMFWVVCSK